MKMEQTERSEMSAYKIQMPGNYPVESNSELLTHLYHQEVPGCMCSPFVVTMAVGGFPAPSRCGTRL